MTGKTVIAIAHHPLAIAAMDQLIIDRSSIVEEGDHASLLKRGGSLRRPAGAPVGRLPARGSGGGVSAGERGRSGGPADGQRYSGDVRFLTNALVGDEAGLIVTQFGRSPRRLV